MNDDRVRLCPHCGCFNQPEVYYCEQCSNSLIEVLPVPRELAVSRLSPSDQGSSEQPITDRDSPPTPQERRCPHPDCDKSNKPHKLICEHCGRRLDSVVPDASASSTNTGLPAGTRTQASTPAGGGPPLLLLVGEHSFECRSGDILGRQGTIASEVFLGVDTVSRQHVLLVVHDRKWWLTVLSDKVTQLDGQSLGKGRVVSLDAGEHSLKLSTRCEVRLRVDQDPLAAEG